MSNGKFLRPFLYSKNWWRSKWETATKKQADNMDVGFQFIV